MKLQDDVSLRPLRADDVEALAEATLGNMNWREERFTREQIAERANIVPYSRLVPDRGDFGFVAERAARVVGVVWLQFRPHDQPGYGYVDESIPELSIWVHGSERRKGLGRALTRAALEETRTRQLAAVSLSVEADNFARHLYADEGFVAVPGREADGVMLWHADATRDSR